MELVREGPKNDDGTPERMLPHQGKVEVVDAKLDEALSMLRAQFKMLSTLLEGVDKLAPKLICFLPAELTAKDQPDWLDKLKARVPHPRDWFTQRVRIFFFAPDLAKPGHFKLAATNEGEGFEVAFPKAWVAKAMPYVKLGLTVLKAAAAIGRLTGFPIPNVVGAVDGFLNEQLQALDELKGEAIDFLAAQTKDPALARELLSAVRELLGVFRELHRGWEVSDHNEHA